MNRIDLSIKVLSPLAIGRWKPGGSVSEAEDYIPGTAIRGAIAAQILREAGRGHEDLAAQGEDFQALFLSPEPAIFQDAHALLISEGRPRRTETACLPATALSSKTNPGFQDSEDASKGGEGVFDTLIDRFCAESYGYPYDPCTLTGERVDIFSGRYHKSSNIYVKPSQSKRLLTRVGINRRRATAEEKILYSIEVLNESKIHQDPPQPMIYQSAILVSDADLASSLHNYINDRSTVIRLGGATSRGLGAVEMTAAQPVKAMLNVQTRITQFNQGLQQRWASWGVFGDPGTELVGDRTFFTIDLQSPTILNENWQRTMVISPAMLQQFAGVQDSSLQLQAAYSSYDYRGGWNAAWGLMKDIELVTNQGATYLFSTIDPTIWQDALVQLELRGVGDRTCEGFGQLRVCDGFHLVFREEAV